MARKKKDIEVEPIEKVIEVLPASDEAIEAEVVDEEAIDVDLPVEDYQDNEEPLEPSLSRDLVRYDPLQAYLRELKDYPHLSKEEELSLAKRYKESADLQAAFKLVTSNLWLVVKIARDYERAAKNVLDLIQEGNIGLMEAVKNFDPFKGVRFPSYAVWWIKAYIVRFIIANWRMVKIGTTQAQRKLFFNLKKEQDKLEKEGFFAAPKLLAERLNVKEAEVLEMQQRMGSADMSVDAPLQPGEDGNLLSVLPAPQENLEEALARKNWTQHLHQSTEEFIASLNEKEAVVFRDRLLSEDKITLNDVATELNLSKERVRQIENRLKDKFKEFLLGKFGDEVEEYLP